MRGMEVADALAADGWSVGVINARFAKPLDTELILANARGKKLVVTLEESVVTGGFGSGVLEAIAEAALADPTLSGLQVRPDRPAGRPLRRPRLGERPAALPADRHAGHHRAGARGDCDARPAPDGRAQIRWELARPRLHAESAKDLAIGLAAWCWRLLLDLIRDDWSGARVDHLCVQSLRCAAQPMGRGRELASQQARSGFSVGCKTGRVGANSSGSCGRLRSRHRSSFACVLIVARRRRRPAVSRGGWTAGGAGQSLASAPDDQSTHTPAPG